MKFLSALGIVILPYCFLAHAAPPSSNRPDSGSYYNVRDFGAIGDGAHDDTSSVNAAIATACADARIHRVLVPAGTYLVFSTLYNTAAVPLVLEGEGSAVSIITVHAEPQFNVVAMSLSHPNLPAAGYPPVLLRGLTINCNSGCNTGVILSDRRSSVLEDVKITNYGNVMGLDDGSLSYEGNGLHISSSQDVIVRRCGVMATLGAPAFGKPVANAHAMVLGNDVRHHIVESCMITQPLASGIQQYDTVQGAIRGNCIFYPPGNSSHESGFAGLRIEGLAAPAGQGGLAANAVYCNSIARISTGIMAPRDVVTGAFSYGQSIYGNTTSNIGTHSYPLSSDCMAITGNTSRDGGASASSAPARYTMLVGGGPANSPILTTCQSLFGNVSSQTSSIYGGFFAAEEACNHFVFVGNVCRTPFASSAITIPGGLTYYLENNVILAN